MPEDDPWGEFPLEETNKNQSLVAPQLKDQIQQMVSKANIYQSLPLMPQSLFPEEKRIGKGSDEEGSEDTPPVDTSPKPSPLPDPYSNFSRPNFPWERYKPYPFNIQPMPVLPNKGTLDRMNILQGKPSNENPWGNPWRDTPGILNTSTQKLNNWEDFPLITSMTPGRQFPSGTT